MSQTQNKTITLQDLRNIKSIEMNYIKRNPPVVDQVRSKARYCQCQFYSSIIRCTKPFLRWESITRIRRKIFTPVDLEGNRESWSKVEYWRPDCFIQYFTFIVLLFLFC